MERRLRFLILLVAALALVPFLPFYVERTLVRSYQVGRAGDAVEWGWRLRTLTGYWSDYIYLRPEQHPALWLGVNLALSLGYALVLAVGLNWLVARLKRQGGARRACG